MPEVACGLACGADGGRGNPAKPLDKVFSACRCARHPSRHCAPNVNSLTSRGSPVRSKPPARLLLGSGRHPSCLTGPGAPEPGTSVRPHVTHSVISPVSVARVNLLIGPAGRTWKERRKIVFPSRPVRVRLCSPLAVRRRCVNHSSHTTRAPGQGLSHTARAGRGGPVGTEPLCDSPTRSVHWGSGQKPGRGDHGDPGPENLHPGQARACWQT